MSHLSKLRSPKSVKRKRSKALKTFLDLGCRFRARALAPPGQEGRERHQENVAQPPNGARGWWVNFQRIPWNLTHHPVCAAEVASVRQAKPDSSRKLKGAYR